MLASAAVLAARAHGVLQGGCPVNGVGERAGDASVEGIGRVSRGRPDRVAVETSIDPQKLFAASQLLSELTGEYVQANKAIVGRNAFAHEAGIHQDGMLKERSTYEIMRPEEVGVPKTDLVLGKHSGRHALRDRVVEMGYSLNETQRETLFEDFKTPADKKQEN